MRIIAIAWMLVGLVPGCKGMGGFGAGVQLFGLLSSADDSEPAAIVCANTVGVTRQRCLAAKFSPKEAAAMDRAEKAMWDRLPEDLDRAMILDGVAIANPRVMACGDGAKGHVIVSVKVAPDGHVIAVTVNATPAPGLGDCVVAIVTATRFAPTRRGGSFRYPFVF